MSGQMSWGQSFDDLVDGEWVEFRGQLADQFETLRASARLAVTWHDNDDILVAVVRNDEDATYDFALLELDPSSLDDQVTRHIEQLGLVLDQETEMWVNTQVASADQVAWAVVELCRWVFAVPTPALLSAGSLTTPAPAEPQMPPKFDKMKPILANSSDEMAGAIEQTLDLMVDGLYRREGGQFVIGGEGNTVRIRPHAERRAVWVVILPVSVRPTSTALRELQIINRDAHFGRYYLSDGWLVAEALLVADPFVPQQLMELISGLLIEARLAKDFAWRTRGRALIKP